MDKNTNAKSLVKKLQMAADKPKRSATKKKKKTKKSTKNEQSPETFEVEGLGNYDQAGESDSSLAPVRPTNSASRRSPSISPPSTAVENGFSDNNNDNRNRCKSLKQSKCAVRNTKSTPNLAPERTLIREAPPPSAFSNLGQSSSGSKKVTVSYSSYSADIQSMSASLSNMSVKSKTGSTKARSKLSLKTSYNGATGTAANKRERTTVSKSDTSQKASINRVAEEAAKAKSEESLRWELALEDEEQERERIKVYKINRRKRYLAAAQAKGLGWVVNYGKNGSPLVEDSLPEVRDREPVHKTITDFNSVRNIIASQSAPMNMGGEITC